MSHSSQVLKQDSRITELVSLQDKSPNTDLDADLYLEGYNLFSTFLSGEELFFIIDGSLFTLGIPSVDESSERSLVYKGKNFSLEESESLVKLENIFIRRNYDVLEDYRKRLVSSLKNKRDLVYEDSLKIESLFKKFSIQRFVLEEVIPLNNAVKDKRSYSEARRAFSLDDMEINDSSLEVSDLMLSESLLVELVNELPGEVVLGLFGNLYQFRDSDQINISDINRNSFISSIESFERDYVNALSEALKLRVKNNLRTSLNRIISAERQIEAESLPDETVNGDMGYSKEGNLFRIFRISPEYIVKKEGDYYLFPEAKIYVLLKKERDAIKISVPAKIEGDYNHPFRSSFSKGSTSICHGSLDWATFGNYPLKDEIIKISDVRTRHLSEKILDAIRGLENILHYGNTASGAVPHSYISTFPSISSDRARSLEGQGVVIYDNDNYSSKK